MDKTATNSSGQVKLCPNCSTHAMRRSAYCSRRCYQQGKAIKRYYSPGRKEAYKRLYEKYKHQPAWRMRRKELALLRLGWTLESYIAALVEQDNRCFLCHQAPSGRWRVLHADHDHKTGKPRKLLCSNCNRYVIGLIEKHDMLERVIAYVKGDFDGRRNRQV